MALFKKSRAEPLPALRLWAGDAGALSAVRAAVNSGDFDSALGIIDTTGAKDRFEIVWAIADDTPYAWALDAVRRRPEDPVVHTLAGAAAMRSGWRVRTDADASAVSGDQFKSFWVWLQEAEEHLVRAAEADPADPTPLVYLLVTGRGLEVPREEIEARFSELLRRDPQHLEGHRQMLQFLCAKWFGSHDDMFGFARSVSSRSPANSSLHELLLFSHFEFYVALQETAEGRRRQPSYFLEPDVETDRREAVSRLGSLMSGPVDGRSVTARNHLVFVAWASKDREAFEAALEATEGVISPMPWNYYAEPLEAVAEAWRALHQ